MENQQNFTFPSNSVKIDDFIGFSISVGVYMPPGNCAPSPSVSMPREDWNHSTDGLVSDSCSVVCWCGVGVVLVDVGGCWWGEGGVLVSVGGCWWGVGGVLVGVGGVLVGVGGCW